MKTGFFTVSAVNLLPQHYLRQYSLRLTNDQKEAIRQLLGKMPHKQIAMHLGIPYYRVQAFLYQQRKQRKLPMQTYMPDPAYDLARFLWSEGKTIRAIAEAYGMRADRLAGVIERYRKHFGLFPRRNRS